MSRRLPLLLLAATSAACSAPSTSVLARVGQADIDGHVAVAEAGNTLTDNSLDDTLGLAKDDSAPGVRVDVKAGSPHFVLAWGNTQNGGDGVLTGDLSDDGETLTAGTDVFTSIELDLYTALVTFDLIPTDMFELGIGLGVHYADLEGLVASRDPGSPGSISVDEGIPIPVLAVQGGFALDRFDISALLSGMDVSADGDSATFYDVDLMARFRLVGAGVTGHIAAGWHYTRLQAEYDDDDGDAADFDLQLSGPYIGIAIGF